jgi:inositol phosphorylceramide synthase regulatory subunit
LLNKVAGVYGLIAVLTGAGGSFAQLSLYIYSVIALVALAWGLRAVKDVRQPSSFSDSCSLYLLQEDPKQTLYFAHLFFADHVLSTAWTVFFAVVWWVYTPHDGQRTVNSEAQAEMAKGGNGGSHNMTDEQRAEAAHMMWNDEKGTAAGIIIISWLIKVCDMIYQVGLH